MNEAYVYIREDDAQLLQPFRPADYIEAINELAAYRDPFGWYLLQPDFDSLRAKFAAGSKPTPLFSYFDWIPVINLDRRPDRWASFYHEYKKAGWPFKAPERWSAIDGAQLPPPVWWKAGAAAWGCAQSHIRILETAMQRGYERILVMEDDAIMMPKFGDKVRELLHVLPNDWDQFYLGGQHLFTKEHPPQDLGNGLYRCYNVNRLHGYALNRKFFKPLYQWLTDYTEWSATPKGHIDHHLGRLHESQKHNIYAAGGWLIGQRGGKSDINNKVLPTRYWLSTTPAPPLSPSGGHALVLNTINTHKNTKPTATPFIVVTGNQSSGTSMIAWMLNLLNVHIGDTLSPGEDAPSWTIARYRSGVTSTQLIEKLGDRFRDLMLRGYKHVAVKVPDFCFLRDELIAALPQGFRVIIMRRPLADSIASVIRRDGNTGDAAQEVTDLMTRSEAGLNSYYDGTIPPEHILTLDYYDTIRNPQQAVDKLISFLGLTPTPEQIATAVSFPNKQQVHAFGGKIDPEAPSKIALASTQ